MVKRVVTVSIALTSLYGAVFALSAMAAESSHAVVASSFADPKDIAAYKSCIRQGRPEKICLSRGDNGVGLWGDDTTDTKKPMCALPREDWQAKWGLGKQARGKKMRVTYRGKSIVCELRDTMPHRSRRLNPAGIDLNPRAARAFDVHPPFLLKGVSWEWLD